MSKMYGIWCEWDIGHEDVIFTSKLLARDWYFNSDALKECLHDECPTIVDLEDAGLVGIKEYEVNP